MKRKIIIFLLLFLMILLPNKALAISIDSVLQDGKFVVPSVPFTGDLAYDLFATYFYVDLKNPGIRVEYGSCNEEFTKCTLTNDEEEKEVEIVWNYDENIKKIVDALAFKYPKDKTQYIIDDFEIINMYINGGNIIENSLEFKKDIQYKNFYIDVRGGGGPELTNSQIGMLKFKLDGVLYWRGDRDPQFISHDLVYVSEDADDIAAALQDRIEKLFSNHTFVVEKTEDKVEDIIEAYLQEARDMYEQDQYIRQEYPTIEDFLAVMTDYNFLDGAEEYLYDIAVDDGFGFQVAVKKDSEKAVDKIDFVTNDILTNVSITLIGNVVLPLDTKIQVEKITSGEEYESIIELLGVKDSETYDLKLYSKGLGHYISELENGKFEVKIPVSDKFKDKKLIVYYVDENKEVKEYEVTIKDGFASFITDHFSIYTLATIDDESIETATETDIETKTDVTEKISNPTTSDNITTYIFVLMLSITVLLITKSYMKDRKFN